MLVSCNRFVVFALVEIDIANTPQRVEIVRVELQDMSVGVRSLGIIGGIECASPETYISIFIPCCNIAGIGCGLAIQTGNEFARLLGELYIRMSRRALSR